MDLSGLGVRWNGGGLGQSNYKRELRQKEEKTYRKKDVTQSGTAAAERRGGVKKRWYGSAGITESSTDPPAVPPTNRVGEAFGKSDGR